MTLLDPNNKEVGEFSPPKVAGLTDYEQDCLNRLHKVWHQKLIRNRIRTRYYEEKNALKDMGISIPPKLKHFEHSIGWAAKAVNMLADRSMFDGFVYKDEVEDGIEDVLQQNNFSIEYKKAVRSELIHSCAFITVSKGGEGEPAALISFYSAEHASAIWNNRLKRIECGMTIVDVDEKTNRPTGINVYTNDAVVELTYAGGAWTFIRYVHNYGRPMMEPLVYRPTATRPMGKSRITRTVMSLVDDAVRESLRTEVGAELFTAPQRYLLGIQDGLFDDKDKWETYVGNILALTSDPETGEKPTAGQFPQMSMEPHISYMRSLAAQFAGETSIPISSLGVIHDNPSSAEAMLTAMEDLIIEADSLNETNGIALRNIGLLIHAIISGKTISELDDVTKSIAPKWKNPAKPSAVSQSSAIIQQVSAIPWLADTEVVLEELGYSESQRMRLRSDKRRIMAQNALQQALMMQEQQNQNNQQNQQEGEM